MVIFSFGSGLQVMMAMLNDCNVEDGNCNVKDGDNGNGNDGNGDGMDNINHITQST